MEVKRTWNPLTLADDRQIIAVQPGMTPAEVIEEAGLVFTRPYYLLVNGQPLGRADWPVYRLRENDICHFVELPRGGGDGKNPLKLVAMVIVAVAAAYTGGWAASLAKPAFASLAGAAASAAVSIVGGMLVNSFFSQSVPEAGQRELLPEGQRAFSVVGGGNELRLGQPFAEHFGKLKIFPDLAQPSYTAYQTKDFAVLNSQYFYFLGIIGVGEYAVDGVYIGETPADEFTDVDYNVLTPSDFPSIVTRIAWPNAALQGTEIGTDYVSTVINPPDLDINRIEIDICFPQLFAIQQDTGDFASASAEITVQVRQVDADGSSLSDWVTYTKSVKGQTTSTYSATLRWEAPFGYGRYEVRIKRSEASGTNYYRYVYVNLAGHGRVLWKTYTYKQTNAAYIGEIRGFGETHRGIAGVTMLEMSVRASRQLTGAIADQVNVICTRKLYPVTETGFGGTLTATRSLIDAVAYMVTSENGGNQDDAVVDFEALAALRSTLETAGYYFDWRFTGRSSVMNACALAAKCGRAIPYMPGGKFVLVQDQAQPTNAMIFTDDDYDAGSFSMEHLVRTADSPTGVRVHYIDSSKWAPAEIDCYDADGSDEKMTDVELPGCTSRQQAYEVGMWIYLTDKLHRSMVQFSTGLKGHIPYPGNRLAVSVPTTDWGSSGLIQSYSFATGAVYLSEDVDFNGEETGVLYITDTDGSAAGPYETTPGDNARHVYAALPEGTPTVATDGEAAAQFIFAAVATDLTTIKVSKVEPQGVNRIRISGHIYDADVYTDPGTAPATITLGLLYSATLQYHGVVSGEYSYTLAWSGTADTVRIEIDEGAGFAIEQDSYSSHKLDFTVASATSISVKVTPYDGELSTDDAITETYAVPGTVTGLALSGDIGDDWTVVWDAVSGAAGYLVELYYDDDGTAVLAERRDASTETATWTVEEMQVVGGPWPSFTVKVAAVIGTDAGKTDDLLIEPDPAATVANLAIYDRLSGGAVIFTWDEPDDAESYVLYQGSADGFDPYTEGTLVYSGTEAKSSAVTISGGYFRVAALNNYVTAVADLNFSTALHVSPSGFVYSSGDLVTVGGEPVFV